MIFPCVYWNSLGLMCSTLKTKCVFYKAFHFLTVFPISMFIPLSPVFMFLEWTSLFLMALCPEPLYEYPCCLTKKLVRKRISCVFQTNTSNCCSSCFEAHIFFKPSYEQQQRAPTNCVCDGFSRAELDHMSVCRLCSQKHKLTLLFVMISG